MKNILLSILLLVGGVSFGQTQETSADTSKVDKPVAVPQIVVRVPVGKLTSFGEISIKITQVVDSRCPADVNCIWAGNVILYYEVYRDGKLIETSELSLGNARKNEDSIFFKTPLDTLIAFAVKPYPKTSLGKIAQEDYVILTQWIKPAFD